MTLRFRCNNRECTADIVQHIKSNEYCNAYQDSLIYDTYTGNCVHFYFTAFALQMCCLPCLIAVKALALCKNSFLVHSGLNFDSPIDP